MNSLLWLIWGLKRWLMWVLVIHRIAAIWPCDGMWVVLYSCTRMLQHHRSYTLSSLLIWKLLKWKLLKRDFIHYLTWSNSWPRIRWLHIHNFLFFWGVFCPAGKYFAEKCVFATWIRTWFYLCLLIWNAKVLVLIWSDYWNTEHMVYEVCFINVIQRHSMCLSYAVDEDGMDCMDNERRPHFPQFSYSASGREWSPSQPALPHPHHASPLERTTSSASTKLPSSTGIPSSLSSWAEGARDTVEC